MAISCQGAHCPQDIMLMGVRWDVAYPWSYRHVEELLEERGVLLDHATVQRWVVPYSPLLAEALPRRQRAVGGSERLDETSSKITGPWYDLSRAVDHKGQTIDVLLTTPRDARVAKCCLIKANRRHGVPEKSPIDRRAATAAAIKRSNEAHGTTIIIRQRKDLQKIVAQDHRAVKRLTRPMLGCKAFSAARRPLVGLALMHMIKKRQMRGGEEDEGRTAAALFYALAASGSPQTRTTAPSRTSQAQFATKPTRPSRGAELRRREAVTFAGQPCVMST